MTFFETYIITLSHYFKILMFSLQGQMHIFFIRADAYLKSISYRYFKKNSRWCNFPLENNLIHWNKDLLMNQHSIILSHYHCVKSIQIRIFFWSVFPVFGLNAENYGVNLRIQCEYRKTRTRKNAVFGHFSRSVYNPIFHLISPHFIFATTSCFRCHQNK